MYRNDMIRKMRLISNFMTSQPGQQTIVIQILSNIVSSKDNQTIKFGQLIDCNMRNSFLKKSCKNCGGGNSPRPFNDKNWNILRTKKVFKMR